MTEDKGTVIHANHPVRVNLLEGMERKEDSIEPIRTREERRRVYLENERWPERIGVSLPLIAEADKSVIRVGLNTIKFMLYNAEASYWIEDFDERGYLVCSLTEGTLRQEGQL